MGKWGILGSSTIRIIQGRPSAPVWEVGEWQVEGRCGRGPSAAQTLSVVFIHRSLWLRTGHVTQNVPAGRTRTPGLGAVTVFCFGRQEIFIRHVLQYVASAAYIWVILYKLGSHENHWLLLQMTMLRQGTYWVP